MDTKTNTIASTTHDDRQQTWRYKVQARASEIGGAVDITITETLDFDARTNTSHGRGIAEGERYDSTDVYPIRANVTPRAASLYRSTHYYIRVS